MLLTMDVGNTNTNFGLWAGNELLSDWRLSTRREATVDDLGLAVGSLMDYEGFRFTEVEDLIISSVVPPMRPSLERFSAKYIKKAPIFVEAQRQKLMPVKYLNPAEVGADRVVVSIAAYRRFKKGVIVVDMGTATTFDCISADGEYLGGAIAPGLRLSADALFQKASRLPKMELFFRPPKAIAQDTVSSINAGLIYGYASLVDGLARRIKAEMGGQAVVVATGGLSTLIAAESSEINEVLPDLTLEGLKIIYYEKAW